MGLNKQKRVSAGAAALKYQPEGQLWAKTSMRFAPRSEEETIRLVHELEVHQIELEMLNAELIQIRNNVESELEQCTNLFDFAPVGYLALDRTGIIRTANLTCSSLLGLDRSGLIGRNFSQFVSAAYRSDFAHFLVTASSSPEKQSCKVSLMATNTLPVFVQIEAVSDASNNGCRLALVDITEREQLETEIQDAREYAENIVETVREPLVVLNSNLKILTANHSFYNTFKVTPEETVGKFIYEVGNRQWDIPQLRLLVEEILPHDTVINGYEVEYDFPDIGHKIMLLNARQIYRKKIGSRIILLAMEDISERKQVEVRLSEVIRQQQAILDNIPNSAWLKDKDGRYVAVNDPFCRAHGVASHELVGKCDHDIYPRELAEKYAIDFKDVIASGARTYYEESTVNQDGKVTYVEKIKTPIFNDRGAVIGIIGIAHDITNRKEIEVMLRHESTHDALTGLYNRAFFDEELERLSHSRMFPVSIVMADVNDLKTINDTQGHDAGDALIRLAARVIAAAFREEDIVARIGGDEFAVLLPETDIAVAEEAVRRIKSCPEITSGEISIAFGIALAEHRGQLTDALKLGDQRMYQDKSFQKGG